MIEDQFSRTKLLIGEKNILKLQKSRVIVFGVGGVGGFVIEALVRAGIGSIDIVDNDIVSESNINRQIIALHSTVGKHKVDVMEKRIKDINPNCNVQTYKCFFLPENSNNFDFSKYDYIVDAVDTVTAKVEIIRKAKNANVPVISCMGSGNKFRTLQFCVTDISKTKVCPLARKMRQLLKKENIQNVKVIYSDETPIVKGEIPASISFVPAIAGLIICGEVINDLLKK